jgi:hypothetical protein
MANTYLSRTPSSAGNTKKWTFSAWFKRSSLGSYQMLIHAFPSSASRTQLLLDTSDQLIVDLEAGNTNRLVTSRQFRDLNNWYHVTVVYDSDNATSGDRVILYVNGVRETEFGTEQYPSSGATSHINTTTQHEIGSYDGAGYYFDGYMSHIHFCDGYVYSASAFGSTDSTTGEWKINTSPSVSYGTNGYWILKDGNSVTDSSPNSNTWAVGGGSLTDVKDNPSMVMATMNPLYKFSNTMNLSNGNLSLTGVGSVWAGASSTLGITSGKYYFETKFTHATNLNWYIGFMGLDDYALAYPYRNGVLFYNNDGGEIRVAETGSDGTMTTADYGIFAQNDIGGFAVDYDNSLFSVYKNNSAIVTNFDFGAVGTSSTLKNGKTIAPVIAHYGSSTIDVNFGNGYFGTTAITGNSGNGYAGADGSSKFNYQPPTGYRALSTKGLNL